MKGNPELEKFFKDQLSVWQSASHNFRALKSAEIKKLKIKNLDVLLQYNPKRLGSSLIHAGSNHDNAQETHEEKCCFCRENTPKEQKAIKFEGRKSRKYNIYINLYPIFHRHYVAASRNHREQSIWKCFSDMTDMCDYFSDYLFFYNGPKSGASIPRHHHFQACPKKSLPLVNDAEYLLDCLSGAGASETCHERNKLTYITSVKEASLYRHEGFLRGVFVLKAETSKSLAKLFYRLMEALPVYPGHKEPMINLFQWVSLKKEKDAAHYGKEYRAMVVARSKHAPFHYFEEGEKHLTIAPGCADMAGCFICPIKDDFLKLDEKMLVEVLDDVAISGEEETSTLWRLTRKQNNLAVAVFSGTNIEFEMLSDGAGRQYAEYKDGKISYNGTLFDELYFDAKTMSTLFAEPSFILRLPGKDGTTERNKYAGVLKLVVKDRQIIAINSLGEEDYLLGVLSSSKYKNSSYEKLCEEAIRLRTEIHSIKSGEIYDFFADENLYKGSPSRIPDSVKKAVEHTWGQVL